jgi:hypothetical protein
MLRKRVLAFVPPRKIPKQWLLCSGGRLTPSHAVKNGRRYRYYISAALITDAGTDRTQGWRLAAREIEEAVIRILADALTNPARLVEPFGTAGMPSDQVRKLLSRVARMAAALNGLAGERAKLVHELVEKIIVDEKTILIKFRRGLLLGGDVPSSASGEPSDSAIELTAVVAVKRRGVKTKLILPGLVQPKQSSKCDPTPIKAIARGRLWFEELATGRAPDRSRSGPELVEAILQGRKPVELTAVRLTERDLPLDWTEQHKLLAGQPHSGQMCPRQWPHRSRASFASRQNFRGGTASRSVREKGRRSPGSQLPTAKSDDGHHGPGKPGNVVR